MDKKITHANKEKIILQFLEMIIQLKVLLNLIEVLKAA